jgi:hypothetical protein
MMFPISPIMKMYSQFRYWKTLKIDSNQICIRKIGRAAKLIQNPIPHSSSIEISEDAYLCVDCQCSVKLNSGL